MEDVKNYKEIWLKSPQERLKIIRNFRKQYQFITDQKLISDVWDLWKTCPEKSKIVDPYNIKSWLTLWEIISIGEICKYSSALAASYLIHYMEPSIKIVICRVYDKIQNDIYITSLINDAYIILPHNQEVQLWDSIKSNIEIQEVWNISDIIDIVNHQITT
jgi:hypothetical protein